MCATDFHIFRFSALDAGGDLGGGAGARPERRREVRAEFHGQLFIVCRGKNEKMRREMYKQ